MKTWPVNTFSCLPTGLSRDDRFLFSLLQFAVLCVKVPTTMRSKLLLFLLLWMPGAGVAQDPGRQEPGVRIEVDVTLSVPNKKKEDWLELRSTNFLAVGDADEKDLRLAVSELELFRRQFALLFPRAKGTSSVPVKLVVLRDGQTAMQFRPAGDEASGEGYVKSGTDTYYVVMRSGEKLSSAMIREYVKLLSKDGITPVPLWFQTGLSEYFGAYKLYRYGKDDRVIKFGLDEYKNKPGEKNLIPLETLFTLTPETLEAQDRSSRELFRTQSCVLFAYLLQTRRLLAAQRLINAMAEGQPVAKSFRDIFKLSIPTFEENLRRNIKAAKNDGWFVTFVGFSLDSKKRWIRIPWGRDSLQIPTNPDLIRDDINSTPARLLNDAEAQFARGDLLLHIGRAAESETYFRKAIDLDSELAPAYSGLGMAKAKQGQFEPARQLLNKAVELDPANAFARYYSAFLTRLEFDLGDRPVSASELRTMKEDLAESVLLAPEFVETSEKLAEAHLLLRDDLNAAIRLLIDGMRRSPGRESIMLTLARVAAAGGEVSSAGWMLQRIIASGSPDTTMKQTAQTLLASLRLSDEQLGEFSDFVDESRKGGKGIDVRKVIKERGQRPKGTPEEKYVRAALVNVDCSKGLTLHLLMGKRDVDERTENVFAESADDIDWVTDTGEETEAVACGTTYRRVAVTYRSERKGLRMGIALVVQFITLPE
jgi:tetratricopeptide (TPR) repeat protein